MRSERLPDVLVDFGRRSRYKIRDVGQLKDYEEVKI
jgi:hypothetical protein